MPVLHHGPFLPRLRHPSLRRHSSYPRRLADLSWQGRRVQIKLQVRRLCCGRPGCEHQIGLTLGGKAGARLAKWIRTPVSGATLLRLICRDAPATPSTAPRMLVVNDWAGHHGQRYGTVLVDLERHAIVDLLPNREADSFAAGLQAHPGVEVVARDDGTAYADGDRRGAVTGADFRARWLRQRRWRDPQPACRCRTQHRLRGSCLPSCGMWSAALSARYDGCTRTP